MADHKPLTLGDLDPRLRELGSDPVPPGSRLHSDDGALPRDRRVSAALVALSGPGRYILRDRSGVKRVHGPIGATIT